MGRSGWICDSYVFEQKVLYKGPRSCVKIATKLGSKEPRAVKRICLRACAVEDVDRQVAILQFVGAGHPNMANLLETFHDRSQYFFVMELCLGGTVAHHIAQAGIHSEREAATVIGGVARALKFIHDKKVCHRDITPDHIVIASRGVLVNNCAKVVDFSQACLFRDGHAITGRVGTAYFSSPEKRQGSYTSACDIWSCGFDHRGLEFNVDLSDLPAATADAHVLLRGLLTNTVYERLTARKACDSRWIRRQGTIERDVKSPTGHNKLVFETDALRAEDV